MLVVLIPVPIILADLMFAFSAFHCVRVEERVFIADECLTLQE